MKPIKTPDTNAVFVMDGCGDFPATKCHHTGLGMDGIQTVWEISPQELEIIQKTGLIYITILGGGVPPIAVSVESMLESVEGDES